MQLLRRKAIVLPALQLIVGLVGTGLTKPYTLFPLILAIGGWLFASRGRRPVRTGYKVLAVVVAVLGLFVAARAFPEYSIDRLGASISVQQRNYSMDGGASVAMGDLDEMEETPGLAKQIKYFPLALLNSLARPFLFEARNVAQLLSGFEMTIVVGLLLMLLVRRGGVRALFSEVTSHPALLAMATFVVSFSCAVGLSTGNLGSLSRYRVPAMPVYLGLLLALRVRTAKKTVAASRVKQVNSPAPRSASAATLVRRGAWPGPR
jgi:hypothetical protein